MDSILVRFVAASLLLLSCGAMAGSGGGYREVGPKEASSVIKNSNGKPGHVILDIRTPEEFFEERIEGAVNIDFRSPAFLPNLRKLDRSVTYLLYCRTGNRSGQALKPMRELGFVNVIHLSDGIVTWKAEGFPTVKGR